mmetsp:Transcript_21620/g.47058  ORF Transcript_21620/g.47058 Transcript_21620/m.47058 type:complete len:183 (+) Transcript_21620:568-1116(+)
MASPRDDLDLQVPANGLPRSSLPPLCSTDSVPPPKTYVILNAANIAFEYGNRFTSVNRFDWEGVRKALRYYRKMDVSPQFVCQSRIAKRNPVPTDLVAYMAQAPVVDGHRDVDDLIGIRLAMMYKCQLVDNDNYRDWMGEDKTLSSPEIREWLGSAVDKGLKVGFIFDCHGRFCPLKDPVKV